MRDNLQEHGLLKGNFISEKPIPVWMMSHQSYIPRAPCPNCHLHETVSFLLAIVIMVQPWEGALCEHNFLGFLQLPLGWDSCAVFPIMPLPCRIKKMNTARSGPSRLRTGWNKSKSGSHVWYMFAY